MADNKRSNTTNKEASTTTTNTTKQPQSKNQGGGQHKSLCSLLHYFIGTELSLELKTGRTYQGTLATADEYMNLTLDDTTVTIPHARFVNPERESSSSASPTNPQQQLFTSVHIRATTIRYIHFPDDLDLTAVIRVGMDRERAASQKYQRGKRSVRSSTTGAQK